MNMTMTMTMVAIAIPPAAAPPAISGKLLLDSVKINNTMLTIE